MSVSVPPCFPLVFPVVAAPLVLLFLLPPPHAATPTARTATVITVAARRHGILLKGLPTGQSPPRIHRPRRRAQCQNGRTLLRRSPPMWGNRQAVSAVATRSATSPSVSGKWHAASPPPCFGSSSGSSVRHSSCAFGQRGLKRQAGGGLVGLGRSPPSTWRRFAAARSGSGTGTADSRAPVYGWRGWL